VDGNAGFEQNALAVQLNGALFFGQYASWDVGSSSEALRGDGNDVIVKYTYVGDFTLDGQVNGDDDAIKGFNYDAGASTGHGWGDGDTNGDGLIDGNDDGAFGFLYGNGTPGNTPQL
jgi:hypothetical protein